MKFTHNLILKSSFEQFKASFQSFRKDENSKVRSLKILFKNVLIFTILYIVTDMYEGQNITWVPFNSGGLHLKICCNKSSPQYFTLKEIILFQESDMLEKNHLS